MCKWIHNHMQVITWTWPRDYWPHECGEMLISCGFIACGYTWDLIRINTKLIKNCGPCRLTKFCAMTHTHSKILRWDPLSRLCVVLHSAKADYVLWAIARTVMTLNSQISLQIQSYIQNGFWLWIREPGGFYSWKIPEVKKTFMGMQPTTTYRFFVFTGWRQAFFH